ncbi:tachykinin-like peptides receptor 99D [Stomoxys calcitrans]|uniref:Tachykinin-like receptor n=1 Tax=Stomoxys calcitrans TaxID=35570 RepID=Q94736_STOCA|nr:tachykinin-like peptides receptor 99D [Stomoxys calcitrans]AAB07000.1 tachykinin-like receptor [Stomoxys calcitrans]
MLDLNIPTASSTMATISSYAAELVQHQQSSDQMPSPSPSSSPSPFGTPMSLLASSAINLTQQQQLTDTLLSSDPLALGTTLSSTASSLYPLVNVASNFMYDWCNQSSLSSSPSSAAASFPASSSSDSIGPSGASSYNCSLLGSSNAFNASSNDTFIDISFILPWWRQVLWSILYGVMVIVATGGNLIVVWIVITTKRMRTVTNYFIVNLSIADAMVSSLNVTFSYIYMLDNNWAFGQLYCKISQFIATLSISASVFTLMAISIDRYVAIMKPLKPRMSKRSNLGIAAVIWIASAIISCPMLLFYTTEEVASKDGIRTVCFLEWPDGSMNHSNQEYVYNILFMILTYFLPVISMTATYSRVGLELWGSKAIGEYTPRQVENVKSKRRVVKMMMVVVLIFVVCWLPFHAYFIVTSCYPAITETPFIQEVYLFIYWLAMSNSMYNPIIYCWMNSRFRFGFKMFFRWCPFVHIGAESLNRRDNLTSRYSCSGSPDHNRIKRNDTQRSFLYTCPGSPKSRRISHCGILRSSTIMTTQRDNSRHSTPITTTIGQNSCNLSGASFHHHHHHHPNHHQQHHHHHHHSSYHERSSLKMGHNSHELAALSGNGPLQLYSNSKEMLLKSNPRSSGGKWATMSTETALPSPTALTTPSVKSVTIGGVISTTFNGGVSDTNYLASRTPLMS